MAGLVPAIPLSGTLSCHPKRDRRASPIGANIRQNGRVNDLSFETRPAGAPQDEVYRSDPHGEERREATRLEPQDLGRSLMLAPMGPSPAMTIDRSLRDGS